MGAGWWVLGGWVLGGWVLVGRSVVTATEEEPRAGRAGVLVAGASKEEEEEEEEEEPRTNAGVFSSLDIPPDDLLMSPALLFYP